MAFSGSQLTRLGLYGGPRGLYGSFAGKAVSQAGVVNVSETVDRSAPDRIVPLYSPEFSNEVITSVYIVSSTDRARSLAGFHRIRVGVSGSDGRTEWVGEWNQSKHSLSKGKRRDLTTNDAFNYPLDTEKEVVIGIDTTGTPATLDGLKVEVKTIRVGEVGPYQYPRPDIDGYPGARSVTRALFDDPAFKGMDTLIDSLNGAAVGAQSAQVALTDAPTAPTYATYVMAHLYHLRDEKSSGTDGGTATTGSWETRVLNTETTAEITGASLASNQITLPAGTYFASGYATAHRVGAHQTRLRDITNSATMLVGSTGYAPGAGSSNTTSVVAGRFSVQAATVIEVQTSVGATKATNGWGAAGSLGENEVYVDLLIWRVL